MQVTEAIVNRKSYRAFLPKEVEKEKIRKILDTARWSPSGNNTQPWEICVVTGKKKTSLTDKFVDAFVHTEPGGIDLDYYPERWEEPFKGRRLECGLQLYEALKIEREDVQKKQDHWKFNLKAFDAPVVMFFFMDSVMRTGAVLDMGMMMQSIMLSAREEGLETCPQAALAMYPSIVKEELEIASNKILVSGLSIGYADYQSPINLFRTSRLEVDQFTRFYE